MKRYWKQIVGVILILASLAGMIGWEAVGREKLMMKKVLVCSRNVEKGEVITKDMLGLLAVDRGSVLSAGVQDSRNVVGKRAANYIPQGMQLCPEFFDDADLTLTEGQKIMSIPDEWLFAYPQTIRRGDTVYFYAVTSDQSGNLPPSGSTAMTSAKVAFVKDSANREVVDVTPERMDASADASNIEIIIDDARYDQLKAAAESGCLFILMYS